MKITVLRCVLLQLFVVHQSLAFLGHMIQKPQSGISTHLLDSFNQYFSSRNTNNLRQFVAPLSQKAYGSEYSQECHCNPMKGNRTSIQLNRAEVIMTVVGSEKKGYIYGSDARNENRCHPDKAVKLIELIIGSIVVSLLVGSILPGHKYSVFSNSLLLSIPGLTDPNNQVMKFLFDKLLPLIWESTKKILLMGLWRRFWRFSQDFIRNLRSQNFFFSTNILSLNEFINRSARRLVIRHVERKFQRMKTWLLEVVEQKSNYLYDTYVRPFMEIDLREESFAVS